MKGRQDLESLFATKMVDGWTDKISFEKLISFDVDQLLSVLSAEMVNVPDLTKEDITEIVDRWADTKKQKESAQQLMPRFIVGLKTCLAEIGYNIKYS